MELISPEEFKKNKNIGGSSVKLIPPAEFKSSNKTGSTTLNLVSPDAFKQSQSKPVSETTKFLTSMMTQPINIQESIANLPKAEPRGTREQPVLRGRTGTEVPLSAKQQEEMDKQLNKELRQGANVSPLERGVARFAEFTDQAINAAGLGIPQAITGGDNRADYERTAAGTIGKLAGEAVPIAKAYSLVNPLTKGIKNTVARTTARGGIVGAGYGTAKELADAALDTREDGQQSIGKRALNVGTEAVLFAGGDAALSALGPVARKIFEGVRARRAGRTTEPVVQGEGLTGEVAAMGAKTMDGRPLLDRGSANVGTTVSKNVTKRSDVIAELSKQLGIPIRTGRFRQKAHGIHKVKPSVVRSRLTNDLPVISHEIGHALDKRYKLSSSAFDDELLELGKNTSGPNYTKGQIRNEGVAEFFRLILTEPAEAQLNAPKFYERFAQAVSSADKAALMNAQGQIRQYINQDILTKSFSEMSVGKRDKRKLPSLNDLYTKFVDDLNPIKQALKPLGEKGKQIFEDFWLLRGSSGRAQAFLKQGRVDNNFNKVGKSFDEIISPVKSNLNEFRAYIKDKRAIELGKRGIMTGSDLTPVERQSALRVLERQYPHFNQVHQELKEYQDDLLIELIRSGVLDPKDVLKFKGDNLEYVPFFRVFEAEAGAGAAKGGRTNVGSGAADQRNPIKRIKGSDREIVDPLESIIKNTYQYIAIAERNKSMRGLIDAVVRTDDLGRLVEKVPTPMQGQAFSLEDLRLTLERQGVDVGALDMDALVNIFRPTNVIPGKENIITVFRNGKREFYQLDPDLYRAVTAADKEQMNAIVRALNFPVRILRSGIVNTLEFWLKNMFRDQFAAMVNSKSGYIPYIDLVRGMYHVLGKTDTFTKFLSAGGAQGLRQSLDRHYLQHDLRNILATSMRDKAMNVLRNPLEAMRTLSELSEMGTRVGDFAKGVKKDGSAAGIKQAAVGSRDLIDFGRAGTIGRQINKISAFWNAHVQGLDKMIRVFTNPKTAPKAFAKSLAVITAPTAALYQVNKDDPRYQELAQWDKDLFWHFWVGDKHFRLPIPFELGVLFKVIPERLLEHARGQEEPFRNLGETTFDSVNVIPGITALTPWIEAYSNKNFVGAPIVPRREEDDLPEDQAGPYTSGTAKAIAFIPGVRSNYITDQTLGSPRKVDHIIRGYAGSLGQYATQGIDQLTDAAGITKRAPRPATGLEDKPGFKAIMGKPFGGSTDSIDRFYERIEKLDEQSKRAEKKRQPFEGAGELKRLEQLRGVISDISKQIRAVQRDPNMSPKQKTAQLRRLNLMSNNMARMGLGLDQLEYEDVFR